MKDLVLKRPIVIVAAVANNYVIGADNTLPWRLSSDLARFRSLTIGKPVIMGRRTFESLPAARPGKGRLPGRPLVVMSRSNVTASVDDGEVVSARDFVDALQLAERLAERDHADEIIVAGGGEVFSQALSYAHRLHITWVEANPEGDAYFPKIDHSVFHETFREVHHAGERDQYAFAFVSYERQITAP